MNVHGELQSIPSTARVSGRHPARVYAIGRWTFLAFDVGIAGSEFDPTTSPERRSGSIRSTAVTCQDVRVVYFMPNLRRKSDQRSSSTG